MTKESLDEVLVSDWTTAIEALDYDGVQELYEIEPRLLWTPLEPLTHLESDFAHFIRRLEKFKILGSSIRPVYALHHILFDYGLPGDEWVAERIDLVEFILKATKGDELNTCRWGEEQNTTMHLAFLLDQSELIQQLLDKGASINLKNKSGHLPTHEKQEQENKIKGDDNSTTATEEVKLIINKKKPTTNTGQPKMIHASDRFRRLRELAESPNSINDKRAMTERHNSTRRYFRPGHLEERKRRVLSEEEEAELEKQRLRRLKEVEMLAQRSAVKNNPLLKKFEQRKPVISAASAIRDRRRRLGEVSAEEEKIRRSSRVINSLKDRSFVSGSVFRQQNNAESDQDRLRVPTLAELRAASPTSPSFPKYASSPTSPSFPKYASSPTSPTFPNLKSRSMSNNKEEEEKGAPNSPNSSQGTDVQQQERDSVTTDPTSPSVKAINESSQLTSSDNKKTVDTGEPPKLTDVSTSTTMKNHTEKSSLGPQRTAEEENGIEALAVSPKTNAISDRLAFMTSSKTNTKNKQYSNLGTSSKVKEIIDVHEHLNDEEEITIYSTGKVFSVWSKDTDKNENDTTIVDDSKVPIKEDKINGDISSSVGNFFVKSISPPARPEKSKSRPSSRAIISPKEDSIYSIPNNEQVLENEEDKKISKIKSDETNNITNATTHYADNIEPEMLPVLIEEEEEEVNEEAKEEKEQEETIKAQNDTTYKDGYDSSTLHTLIHTDSITDKTSNSTDELSKEQENQNKTIDLLTPNTIETNYTIHDNINGSTALPKESTSMEANQQDDSVITNLIEDTRLLSNSDHDRSITTLHAEKEDDYIAMEGESDEDEATTPTLANPHPFEFKQQTTHESDTFVTPNDESEQQQQQQQQQQQDWRTAYDNLMAQELEALDFDDDDAMTDDRRLSSSDLDEDHIINSIYQKEHIKASHHEEALELPREDEKSPVTRGRHQYEEEEEELTVEEQSEDSIPREQSQQVSSTLDNAKKRQSGSQRLQWSTGIQQLVTTTITEPMKRESWTINNHSSSETGSEQWFDPDDDWATATTTTTDRNEARHSQSTEPTIDRSSPSIYSNSSSAYSLKNSNSTEDTKLDDDDFSYYHTLQQSYHDQESSEKVALYSNATNISSHTLDVKHQESESETEAEVEAKVKVKVETKEDKEEEEGEGEIVVFMNQDSPSIEQKEVHNSINQSLLNPPINNASKELETDNEDDTRSLIHFPSRSIVPVAEASQVQELVPHDPENPRVEDISHYMNALPSAKSLYNDGRASLFHNEDMMVKRAISKKNNVIDDSQPDLTEPEQQNYGIIPSAHEVFMHEPPLSNPPPNETDYASVTEKTISSSTEVNRYGKMYIAVSGAHHVLLPLPKEITYVRCVISDGEYEYMSRYEILSHQILMDYECMIDTKPGMIITVSLHVRPDYHVRPKTGLSRWFTSIRKQKEHLSGYVHPEDGAIGQTRFAVDHMVPGCYKKTYEANFDCFNSWYARTSRERARREQFGDEEDFLKIVGKLNIEMLYLPVSHPSVQVPRSLRECDLTLKIRQWHDTCWHNGFLSTRRQGTKIWKRHFYRLIGSQLVGYTADKKQVWDHYNIADVIRLSAAADKVIVTLMEEDTTKVFTDSIHTDNHKGFFRLSFPDYYLDCVSDDLEESEEWVRTLKSMIGRVPLRLPFSD
ncbi:MAG: hypothetical protein EXX96DRAFT_587530 [Benjaminiella poitrasii]|nr:MAG: hypothetical protein EXX96DRAFT_587530 [Benjaminiella poitrasii]